MTDPVIKSPAAVAGTVRIGAVRAVARRDASAPPARGAPSVQPPVLQPLVPQRTLPPGGPVASEPPKTEPEFEQLRTSAHAAGHAAGYEAGLSQGLAEGRATAQREYAARDREMRDALAATLAGMQDAQQRFQQDLGKTALDIAFVAIVQAFGRLSGHESVVWHAVCQAMDQAGALSDARLHLHPQDAEAIAPLMQELAAERRASWTVCADAGITRGGCRISSPQGEIDATIESQLRNLAALLQRYRDAGPEPVVAASHGDAVDAGAAA